MGWIEDEMEQYTSMMFLTNFHSPSNPPKLPYSFIFLILIFSDLQRKCKQKKLIKNLASLLCVSPFFNLDAPKSDQCNRHGPAVAGLHRGGRQLFWQDGCYICGWNDRKIWKIYQRREIKRGIFQVQLSTVNRTFGAMCQQLLMGWGGVWVLFCLWWWEEPVGGPPGLREVKFILGLESLVWKPVCVSWIFTEFTCSFPKL